jgi:hypothetical protein
MKAACSIIFSIFFQASFSISHFRRILAQSSFRDEKSLSAGISESEKVRRMGCQGNVLTHCTDFYAISYGVREL